MQNFITFYIENRLKNYLITQLNAQKVGFIMVLNDKTHCMCILYFRRYLVHCPEHCETECELETTNLPRHVPWWNVRTMCDACRCCAAPALRQCNKWTQPQLVANDVRNGFATEVGTHTLRERNRQSERKRTQANANESSACVQVTVDM